MGKVNLKQMFKILAIFILLGAVCLFLANSSQVRAESEIIPTLIVIPTSGHVGDRLKISGSGYSPKTTIRLIWDETKVFTPTNQTDSRGNIRASLSIPLRTALRGQHTLFGQKTLPGIHTLRATVGEVTSPTVNILVIP